MHHIWAECGALRFKQKSRCIRGLAGTGAVRSRGYVILHDGADANIKRQIGLEAGQEFSRPASSAFLFASASPKTYVSIFWSLGQLGGDESRLRSAKDRLLGRPCGGRIHDHRRRIDHTSRLY